MNQLYKCISDVVDHIHDYTLSPSDFTRSRKLPAAELIRFLLNMEGNSLSAEIFNSFPEIKSRMTASAFVQQRTKLKPEALKELLSQYNSSMKSPKTFNGLRLYAIDGSDFCTPFNKESKWCITDHYFRKDGQEIKGACLLHGNFLYDLLNKQYINVCETRDERGAAIKLINEIEDPKHSLTIMDRGYFGFNMIEHCNRSGGYYIMRVPVNAFKELGSLPNDICDDNMEIKVSTKSYPFCNTYGYHKINTRKRSNKDYSENTANTRWDFEDTCVIKTRVCKFRINDPDTGKEVWEVLATNLPRNQFPLQEMKRLYWRRWGIETSFRSLKYALGAINFHSRKDEFILQELYAHLIMFNAVSRAAAELPSTISDTGRVYEVDFKMAVYVFRMYFRSYNKAPPDDMYADMTRYRHLIKKGKHSKRLIKPKSAVYFMYRVA
ncbi:MAG: IS4 family transposase [Lachnospiraceae bacterium]|nr:IS4 family transposase [Lachnospiraceae bacterium]